MSFLMFLNGKYMPVVSPWPVCARLALMRRATVPLEEMDI